MKIKSIEINAFRGIPFLKLDLHDGKGLVLQGENGTGKSSIADAIEFFFTGDITQLKGKQSVSLKKHGTNVNFTPDDLKIEMVIKQDNTDYTIERTLNSSVKYPESLENYFNVADKRTFILRRSQVLKFIESSPSDRYNFIGTVLGVEKLESIELEMQRAQKYLKEKIKEKNDKIIKIKEKLSFCLDSEIENEKDLIPAINQLFGSKEDFQLESVDEIEDCYKKLDSLANQDNIDKFNAIKEISSSIETINTLNDDIMKEFHQADSLKTEILEIHGISDLPLIKILRNAKEILQRMDLEKCPLCEQTIHGEELQARIDERLETLEDLSGSKEKLKESIKSLKRLFKSLHNSLKTINNNVLLFAELDSFCNYLNSEMELLQIFTDEINYQIFLQGAITREDLNNRIEQLERILDPINNLINDIKASLENSNNEDNIISILKVLREVNDNYLKLLNIQKQISIFQKHEQIAATLFSTFSEVKKQKIQEIYDSIEQDIQYFYDSLHPHESHRNIKLGVDPGKRSSTNLKMEIFGRDDEDPRGLNSEGHLDSLGLCVFLALVNKFNHDFPIVVLDDVVTTVDSRHREKVCKLLFEEFKDKQFIITTHDAIWFDQLRAAQRAYKLDNKFRNMNIVSWDLEGGPILKPYVPIKNRIQQKIEAGDRNCAGNEVRRYLEWLLDEICKNTNAPVPLNPDGRYEAKVLFDSARNRLIDKVKDQVFKENVIETFQNLEKTMIMGNILSHNNLFAGNISINEVENFWKSVQEIEELMSCPNCGKPLKQYKELEILRCSKINCQNPLIIRFR